MGALRPQAPHRNSLNSSLDKNLHRITRGFGRRFEKNWSKKSGGLSRAPRRNPVRTVTWGMRST